METALLAEDEPAIRSLAAEVLRRQGYTVLEAVDGEEALRVAQEHLGEEIHLLLADVIMPRMDGRQLARRLKSLMPRMRVLFTSGLPAPGGVPDGDLGDGITFLPKPFTPAVLAQRVREVLDAPDPGL